MQAADHIKLTLPKGVAQRGDDAALLVRQLMAAAPVWKLGATGPYAFDCWSMHQLVQAHLFDRDVTVVRMDAATPIADIRAAVAAHPANVQWIRREGPPQHGDGVKMGLLGQPFHIGIYLALDRGMVLHHTEVSGLCCDTLVQLRVKGYRNVAFYRWAADHAGDA